jgi:hypothetical protein
MLGEWSSPRQAKARATSRASHTLCEEISWSRYKHVEAGFEDGLTGLNAAARTAASRPTRTHNQRIKKELYTHPGIELPAYSGAGPGARGRSPGRRFRLSRPCKPLSYRRLEKSDCYIVSEKGALTWHRLFLSVL